MNEKTRQAMSDLIAGPQHGPITDEDLKLSMDELVKKGVFRDVKPSVNARPINVTSLEDKFPGLSDSRKVKLALAGAGLGYLGYRAIKSFRKKK